MITKDGKKVKIEEIPSEEVVDKKTGKVIYKPKRKKIVDDEGTVEEVEELEDEEPTEYDKKK